MSIAAVVMEVTSAGRASLLRLAVLGEPKAAALSEYGTNSQCSYTER